ncbi:hypothetical protein DFH09DRAFT_1373453 [Mycena vulgaris]|nr:hypothetical protein DFH09DRAFT_1373453 [Mycena vulgaris]
MFTPYRSTSRRHWPFVPDLQFTWAPQLLCPNEYKSGPITDPSIVELPRPLSLLDIRSPLVFAPVRPHPTGRHPLLRPILSDELQLTVEYRSASRRHQYYSPSMPPKPPQPSRGRSRGRPPRRRKAPGIGTDPEIVQTPASPTPPGSTLDDAVPTPFQGIPLTGDAARYALLAAQNSERTPGFAAGAGSGKRLFLNALPHKPEDNWKLLKDMPVEDLAPWFDDLLNDFNPYEMLPAQDSPQSLAVAVRWIGHPGDSPRDPRARRCFIRWNDPPPVKSLIDRAVEKKTPVVRWDLRCAGVHDLDFTAPPPPESAPEIEDEGTDEVALDDEEDEEEAESEILVTSKVKRWRECSSLVKLHCEVYPNDLSRVFVWQQNNHPDVPLADRRRGLKFSRIQRTLFLENLRLHGAKVSSLVIEAQRTPFTVLGRTTPLPEWREPAPTQLESLYVAVKHRQLLDRNPWRATHLLVKANKDKIFQYHPHDFSKPDSESQFTIGLTDDYSLDSSIAYTPTESLGSDQCWRNKSQNRAALSLLCTVDEGGHMVPVSVFISAKANRETIFAFLDGTYQKVMDRARAIVADPSIITTRNRSPKVIAEILENAKDIVANGWRMASIMMDKHWPSLLAIKDFIKKYKLTVYIRICQFHVVQAIIRWEWEDGRKGLETVFFADIHDLLLGDEAESRRRGKPRTPEQKQSMYDAVCKYFTKNWFVPSWQEYYTDIGMPPNQSRDGTWNTNNWTESAFKTFDSVFLQNRQNKRIDRLALTVLCDFLPYYQYWRPRDRNPPQDVLERHFEAHTLWDRGAVTEVERNRYQVEVMMGGEPLLFEVTMNPMSFKCTDYQQSGKECVHILAVKLLISSGPVESWKAVEAVSETAVAKKRSTDPKRKKQRSDEAETAAFYDILDRLAKADEAAHEESASPEPPFQPPGDVEMSDFAEMGKTSGRPQNSTVLQSWRSQGSSAQRTSEPHFSQRPGRPAAGRLGPNSLFSGTLKGVLTPSRRPRHVDDGEFWEEEHEMITGHVNRWGSEEYTVRAEEMGVWTVIGNYSEVAQRDGWLFLCCSPVSVTRDIMESLDWSTPVTIQELRSKKLGFLAEILEARSNKALNHIVCFHLHVEHWTVFHHDLTGARTEVSRLNPLVAPAAFMPSTSPNMGFTIEDQVVLCEYLNPKRALRDQQGQRLAKPKLNFNFLQSHLGLQRSDSTTCGFWSVLIVFSFLLGFKLDTRIIRDMDKRPIDLKELLAPVYSAFLRDPIGTPLSLVQELFMKFSPSCNYSKLTSDWFSSRPANIPRAVESPTDPGERPESSRQPEDLEGPPVRDPGVAHLIDAALGDVQWVIGAHLPSAQNIRDLLDGKELHNVVLDAYLDLFVRDLIAPPASYRITDSIVGNQMQTQNKNGAAIEGMKPKTNKHQTREYWFPSEDIFLLDFLIIPWFWVRHWLLVAIDFNQKQIRVYDSHQTNGGKSRGLAATQRVHQMLRFEHRARNQSFLGKEWSAELTLLDVPQQGSTVNCGVYVIWFAKQLASGHTDLSSWKFTSGDSDLERIRIANRLSAAIHADVQERNVRQMHALGISLPINVKDEDPLGREEYTLHLLMVEAMQPRLASTDITRLPSLETWSAAQHQHRTVPEVGSCVLFPFAADPTSDTMAYPALVTHIDDSNLEYLRVALEWFPGIYGGVPEGTGLLDSVSLEAWEYMIEARLSVEELVEIEWPALLMKSPNFFPSPVYPYQQGLADHLVELLPLIIAIYRDPTGNPPHIFTAIDARFRARGDPDDFYKLILGAAPGDEPFCPADEAYFTQLGTRIRDGIPWGDAYPGRSPHGPRNWIKGAARVMLACAAAGHYLDTDLVTALALLEARQVYRARSMFERVWDAYIHSLSGQSVAAGHKACDNLQIARPGIQVPLPRRREADSP